jgi:hypothetical protein
MNSFFRRDEIGFMTWLGLGMKKITFNTADWSKRRQ